MATSSPRQVRNGLPHFKEQEVIEWLKRGVGEEMVRDRGVLMKSVSSID
ncbi:hypothetical protein [uncultured Anaerovibrio sp.]|nr:hypothetical protein [uncultured Anaerovibrio sp.]